MSDDPIRLMVKLDDNQNINLSRFLDSWKSKGFVIENRINNEYMNVYSEYVSDDEKSYPLNYQTYNSIYLPNAKSTLWVNLDGEIK